MKNKEIEELLNKMKNCNGVFDYYLEYGEVDLLLSYIEQLENNRDKAIEFINSKEFNNLTTNKRKKLNDILKGDSNE